MLRASGEKDGEDFDLNSVVGSGDGDAGVVHGKLLLAFADAVFGDDDAELDRRRAALPAPADPPVRGYARLYADHITQADQGADFDFLIGK